MMENISQLIPYFHKTLTYLKANETNKKKLPQVLRNERGIFYFTITFRTT